MKRMIAFIFSFLVVVSLAGCAGQQGSTLPTAPAATIATPATATPVESTPSPIQTTSAPVETAAPVIKDGPIPGLLGEKWYDWDKVGAYPGSEVAAWGGRIAFQTIAKNGSNLFESHLSLANTDGSDSKYTDILINSGDFLGLLKPSRMNYRDGWVYLIRSDNGKDHIYKVKEDGTSPIRLPTAEDTQYAEKEYFYDALLLINDKLYFTIEVEMGKVYHSVLARMNTDGSYEERLEESDSRYFSVLYYDAGKFYYECYDVNEDISELYQLDIATGASKPIGEIDTLDIKFVVRGDQAIFTEPYDSTNDNICMVNVCSISSGKKETLIDANLDIIDYALFDRWLLMIDGFKGLLGYDFTTGKLYLLSDSPFIDNVQIAITADQAYLQSIISGSLYPIQFANGKVTIGPNINEAK